MSRERLVCVDPRTSCRILGQKTRNLQQIPPCLVSKFSVKNKLPNAAVIDGILIELTVVLPSEHHHGICREREFRGEFKICFGSENKALLEPVFFKNVGFF